ncbi:SH3 domain-containing protein [Leptospira gomenensis]|nr:SH3 domain-containing protein [Leptospira gomenensis]
MRIRKTITPILIFVFLNSPRADQTKLNVETDPKTSFAKDETPAHKFYKVITKTGLHLRETPSVKAKSLGIVEYRRSGEILEKTKTLETISGKNGYWIRATRNDTTGWMFSGYLLLSQTAEFPILTYDSKDIGLEITGVEEITPEDQSRLKNYRDARTLRIGSYQIQEKSNIQNPSQKLVLFSKNGKFHKNGFAEAEWIQKHKIPVANLLVTGQTDCFECCGMYEEYYNLYFVKDTIQRIAFPLKDREAFCGEEMESLTAEVRNRIDVKNGIIYHYYRIPNCEYKDDKNNVIDLVEGAESLHEIRYGNDGALVEIRKITLERRNGPKEKRSSATNGPCGSTEWKKEAVTADQKNCERVWNGEGGWKKLESYLR